MTHSYKKIKVIIFDLDDTLYPEREFAMSGFKKVSRYLAKKYKLSFSAVFNILKNDFDAGIRGKNFNLLLKKLKLSQPELKNLINIYRNHKPEIKLYPDAKKILNFLKNRKFKIALISDGRTKTQKNKLKSLKINNVFNPIIVSDSFGRKYRKPHQKTFLIALKKLGVKPQEAVYIADNPAKDFIAPKKLWMPTVRIKRPGGEYENVRFKKKNDAELIINNLVELKRLFGILKIS